jgi:hypothetical protein
MLEKIVYTILNVNPQRNVFRKSRILIDNAIKRVSNILLNNYSKLKNSGISDNAANQKKN